MVGSFDLAADQNFNHGSVALIAQAYFPLLGPVTAGVHGLHCGDEWRYFRPLLDGDEVHATKMLVRAEPMQGRLAGDKMFIQADEIRFYNQNDELVAIQVMPIIRAEREESKKRGKYSSIERATYTETDIAQIDKELENELPRSATPRRRGGHACPAVTT